MYKGGYVYIITNENKTTLYIGVTSGLELRLWKHKTHFYGEQAFSARYNLGLLIYYELFDSIVDAIAREKQLKKWSRSKKEVLINRVNPGWKDLSDEIVGL